MNHLGQEKEGIAYEPWLKKVERPDFKRIRKIITFKQKRFVKVSFYNFPPSFYVELELSDLHNYQYSKAIRRQIRLYKEKHGIQD